MRSVVGSESRLGGTLPRLETFRDAHQNVIDRVRYREEWMLQTLVEQFPRVFEAAIKTPLGVLALLACIVGLLAWLFFGKEHWGVKMGAFVLIFGGVCVLGYAVFDAAKEAQHAAEHRNAKIAECLAGSVARFQDRKTQEVRNQVRCEGAGVGGGGHSQSDVVAFDAPPGYVIVGRPEVLNVEESRGQLGDLQFIAEDGVVRGVRLPISCSSPSQLFGPGAWMRATLRSTIERPVQDTERARLRQECNAEYPKT